MLSKINRSLRLRKKYSHAEKNERACPLCCGRDTLLIASRDRNFIGISTVQCMTCGFIFTNPYFTSEGLNDFYSLDYRRLTKGRSDPRKFLEKRPWMQTRASYFESKLNLNKSSIHLDYGRGEGALSASIYRAEKNIRLHLFDPNLLYARHAAESCEGTVWESDSQLAKHCQKKFDSISLVHVLEHVIDPIFTLTQLGRLLKPNGSLYLDVPDATKYSGLSDLHISHCSHFSPATLGYACEVAGLEVLELSRHSPPFLPKSLWLRVKVSSQTQGSSAMPSADTERATMRTVCSAAEQSLWSFLGGKIPFLGGASATYPDS